MEYSTLNFIRASGVSLSVYAYNNLFRSNTFNVCYTNSTSNPIWNIQDNLFDSTPQTLAGSSAYLAVSNNAFTTNTANTLGGPNCKTNLTRGYVSGPSGNYYYPATGGATTLTALIDAGSRKADAAGLFHYTTTTNILNGLEIKETNPVVDIGYHYVAVDSNGNPIDTDKRHDSRLFGGHQRQRGCRFRRNGLEKSGHQQTRLGAEWRLPLQRPRTRPSDRPLECAARPGHRGACRQHDGQFGRQTLRDAAQRGRLRTGEPGRSGRDGAGTQGTDTPNPRFRRHGNICRATSTGWCSTTTTHRPSAPRLRARWC